MIADLIRWFGDPLNWQGNESIPFRVLEHLSYSVVSLLIAAAIAIPLGLWIGHTGRGGVLVAGLANAFRAIPTFGLLIAAVILLSGIFPGPSNLAYVVPAIVALVVLAVPPILAATYAGVQGVDPSARDAAYGMGMTGGQVLLRVESPNAMPLIMSGLRSAMLQVISTATLAAYAGLNGLGRYIFDGQANRDFPMMLGGALLVGVLAIVAELALAGAQRAVVSTGLRQNRRNTPR